VIATPAGSTPDVGARLLAHYLTEDLKQPVIVENKPGVNGLIAARDVLKSPADGYTVLVAPSSTMAVTPHVYKKQAGQLLSDFAAVSQIYQTDMSLIVRAGEGLESVAALMDAARTSPGKLTAAYAAVGSASHVAIELFKQQTGLDIYAVPFNTSPAAALAVASGNADLLFETVASTEPVVSSGRARRIAMTGATRFRLVPTLPTIVEAGVPQFVITTWAGAFVPRGVAPDRVTTLSSAIGRALANRDMARKLHTAGLLPGDTSAPSFDAFWRAESAMWEKTVNQSKALQQE
jgi:tripartite-type tricarboxylate transporter receptor subunit TctC